jgi:hypothetical protein
MFVRIKRGGNEQHPHDYLQIVESYRDGGRPKQRLIANLGRLDQLLGSGDLDGLIQSLARFSQTLRVMSAARAPQVASCQAKLWGPALVFGRLWQRQGIDQVLGELATGRKFGFDLERACFALALQRLCLPGSDLQGSSWVQTVEAPGFSKLALQHFYRAVGFLAEVRSELERELFRRDRDLFSQELDLLFIDTTSVYVYRDTETAWRRRGYSRDRRADLPQLVLCVAVDRHGWPVAWEVFPGQTADKAALVEVIAVLRQRLQIRRVIVVADRGMISQGTLSLLAEDEQAPFDYILGCRMRRQKEVNEEVLGRAGRYEPVADNLEVKEVWVENRRYIVCRNPEEAEKDALARQAILDHLTAAIEQGAKKLVGNTGYRRFLTVERGALRINQAAVEVDVRLDGKFVLRTNTALPAAEVAQTYKSLWRVERTFREQKSTLEVRPLYHHRDDTSIGHIVASFLALRLEVDLQRRMDEKGVTVSWPQLMQDLAQVRAVHMELDGQPWRIRTNLAGQAYEVFRAAGLRPPSRVTPSGQETEV